MISIRNWLSYFLLFLFIGGCSSNQKLQMDGYFPSVNVDAGNEFWRDQVHYPYDVTYAKVEDYSEIEWNISYMDVYKGNKPVNKAKTLILVHGRGANAGYFSQLMNYCVAAGMRVIAVDIPGYGKSIPENMGKPIARSLDSTREAIYRLIVEQLGIEKAVYLGHSMGGLWVIGYALRYPDVVDKIILESSYGLEEFPTKIRINKNKTLSLFEPDYSVDFYKWRNAWEPLGHISAEKVRNENDIRASYYFKQINPETGKLEPSDKGYFLQDSIDANFLTQVRVSMMLGDLKEYENYINTYAWDMYALGIEIQKNDPKSIYKQIGNLKMPVFMIFGDKDPFIPSTSLSGNTDLRKQVIKPVYMNMLIKGHEPIVTVYNNSGHVLHADNAERFTSDVIKFINSGTIDSPIEKPMDY